MEKDGEKKRWRGEVAEKEENVTRRLEKLSFEVAAGSFTFRNEIVLLLSLSLSSSSSDRSFSLSPLPSSLRLLFVSLAYHDPPRCILERLRLRCVTKKRANKGRNRNLRGSIHRSILSISSICKASFRELVLYSILRSRWFVLRI